MQSLGIVGDIPQTTAVIFVGFAILLFIYQIPAILKGISHIFYGPESFYK